MSYYLVGEQSIVLVHELSEAQVQNQWCSILCFDVVTVTLDVYNRHNLLLEIGERKHSFAQKRIDGRQ